MYKKSSRFAQSMLVVMLTSIRLVYAESPGEQASDQFFFVPDAYTQINITLDDMRLMEPEPLEDLWYSTRGDEETPLSIWRLLVGNFFAAQDYERTLETLDSAARALGELPIEFMRVRAMCHEAQQNWPQAAEAWHTLVEKTPDDPVPSLRAIYCRLHMGQNQEALQALRHLTRRLPREPGPYHVLGALYWLGGDTSLAWRSLARAVRLPGVEPDTFIFLAWIAAQDGDHEEAVGWLRRGLPGLPHPKQQQVLQWAVFDALKHHDLFPDMLAQLDITLEDGEEEEAPHDRPKQTGVVHTETTQPPVFSVGLNLELNLRPESDDDTAQELPADTPGLHLRPPASTGEVIIQPEE
jgi:tetratricopeptide (TPR) repeat protein